ncbi:MAG: L-serine ammonia-lyase, iron-sulfur-dependent, subunit alpha [Clostridiaceae bacterium]|nr:L-serine ammonia-lyase, iron-sulfur-dependent, subunit alpha [Eubacteriales bacterium]
MQSELYRAYVNILHEELLTAMGCTEPIAIAYAAALAREALGALPKRMHILVSGNIVKNVKSVIVPHTGGMKGISAAAAAGAVAGRAAEKLEALSRVTQAQLKEIAEYLKTAELLVEESDRGCVFDIEIRAYRDGHSSMVHISGHHTDVVRIEKDGGALLCRDAAGNETPCLTDRGLLNVESIVSFADEADLADVRALLKRQIELNTAIAEEGIRGDYGARIGKIMLASFGSGVTNRAKAMAAAGSDARMSGCELPVVINSGSGNQGITASLPVIVYARELQKDEDALLRALVVSNLITIHLKTGIGRLSAYCGVVSAGCGAGAGVMYLHGGGREEIAHTVVNALAINSGIICDGAKASCAAKIVSSVEAGLLGMYMYMHKSEFLDGDGIVVKGVESTIKNVGELAREGMRETDKKIISLMLR